MKPNQAVKQAWWNHWMLLFKTGSESGIITEHQLKEVETEGRLSTGTHSTNRDVTNHV